MQFPIAGMLVSPYVYVCDLEHIFASLRVKIWLVAQAEPIRQNLAKFLRTQSNRD